MERTGKPYIYIYPKLPSVIDFGIFRFGGSGLANCMFVAAKAMILSYTTGYPLLEPTWAKFSPGPYLRGEKDKRHYMGIFKKSQIKGLSKIWLLLRLPSITLKNTANNKHGIIKVEGLGNYFADLLEHQQIVLQYFESIILPKVLNEVNKVDFSDVIGVHIRLGDYIPAYRTDIKWYEGHLRYLIEATKGKYQIFIFSDGSDEELKSITKLRNCKRVFFGNALADMIALSKCRLIVGSDSTFTGWGAFLGQVPVIFPRRHFSSVLINQKNEMILDSDAEIGSEFIDSIGL